MQTYPDSKHWTQEETMEFITANTRYIRHLVMKYANLLMDHSIDFDDLMQEACITVLYSLKSYDPSLGTPVESYIKQTINNMLTQKYRYTRASKREGLLRARPFDSIPRDEDSGSALGADNMDVTYATSGGHQTLEDTFMTKMELEELLDELRSSFPAECVDIFIALSLKLKTQMELAKEHNCSQAKISHIYTRMRRFCHEITSYKDDEPSTVRKPRKSKKRSDDSGG